MKRALSLFALVFWVAVPLNCHAASQPNDVRAKIDQYMNAVVNLDHFMGSVLVARGNRVLLAKGYGMADVKANTPNTPETEFRIGSVTKQFTAMAILMLQEEHKLKVQDPVCKYVPACPKDWQPIKIFNLLTHTSGIPNFTAFPNYIKVRTESLTPAQLVNLFKDKPLDFTPGAKFSYSNSGYVLLGYIIERVSGESYRQFLQQKIFGPLGMKHSDYDDSHPDEKTHAKGYSYVSDKFEPAPYVNMSVPFSAGALYSTVEDMYIWDRALTTHKLVPESLQKEMFTPHVPVTGDLAKIQGATGGEHYGFGWFIKDEFGRKEYSHEGGIAGFTSLNGWFPEQNVYVIVLDNMTSPNIFEVGKNLAAIAFGEKYTIPKAFKAISLPAKDLEKFVGFYQMAPKRLITITQTGDQLKTQLTGQPAFPIYPESKTRFFLKAVRAEVLFQVNGKDQVTGLVIQQGGGQFPAKRISAAEAAKAVQQPKTISMSPESLQKFAGSYQLAPGFVIAVTLEGDRLKAQATGQPSAPIFPESNTEFFYKVADAQITFKMDDNGKVTGLVLHQHGRDMPAEKIK